MGAFRSESFYVRRAIRILPPTYIAIALCVVVGATAALPSAQNVWGILAQLLNYTNYYMIWSSNETGDAHSGLPPESSMLWSLAVEEHFYLIFPAILIVLLRRKLTFRTVGFLLVGACALAPLWRLVLALNDADFYRLYVATDTRFDGLLAGAAMALLANPALKDAVPFGLSDRLMRFVLAPIAAVVAVVAAFLPGTAGLVIADTIIYVCLVVLFWVVITWPDGLCGRVLNNRLVAHIGVLSFSIYLLHRLVLGLAQLVTTVPLFVDIASLLITVVLAQAMFIGVERPLGSVRKKLEARVPVPRESASVQAHHRG